MWKLVIEDDEGKRTVVHLTRDQYTVGRKEGNSIRLTERNVSREHAKLSRQSGGAGYTLEDLDSYNGVFVNGVRLSRAQDMAHGDLIQVGDYRVVIQDDAMEEAPAGAPTAPDPEDLKATLVPGRARPRGTMLLERPNRFVMLVGPTPGAEYPLDQDLITIGRAEEAVISVNHNSVSRMHCEIHKLAEGRYEIVDIGSSNGVRVNGSDLSRGIIEAGDIIELGDVRFRFVAAGQVFLANASDSQQLAAIADRDVSALLGVQKKSSVLPWALLGLVVGGVVVAALYFLTRAPGNDDEDDGAVRPATSSSAAAAPVVIPERESIALAEAVRLARTNPEQAHDKLLAAIPFDSPARQTAEYREVEGRWADDLFIRADREREHEAAVNMLRQVAQSPSVSEAQRARALQGIADRGAAAQQTPPPATVTPPSTPGPATRPHTPTTPPAEKTPKQSLADQARDAMKAGDVRKAYNLLKPRLNSGSISAEERSVLRPACKAVGDRDCMAKIDAMK